VRTRDPFHVNRPAANRAVLTSDELRRLRAYVAKTSRRAAPRALGVGLDSLVCGLNGEPIMVVTRDRLITSLAREEQRLAEEGTP
jgi:hypothetical protein